VSCFSKNWILTGSRYFGYDMKNSDYDFISFESNEVIKELIEMDFVGSIYPSECMAFNGELWSLWVGDIDGKKVQVQVYKTKKGYYDILRAMDYLCAILYRDPFSIPAIKYERRFLMEGIANGRGFEWTTSILKKKRSLKDNVLYLQAYNCMAHGLKTVLTRRFKNEG
jgi:hypothetical protein